MVGTLNKRTHKSLSGNSISVPISPGAFFLSRVMTNKPSPSNMSSCLEKDCPTRNVLCWFSRLCHVTAQGGAHRGWIRVQKNVLRCLTT